MAPRSHPVLLSPPNLYLIQASLIIHITSLQVTTVYKLPLNCIIFCNVSNKRSLITQNQSAFILYPDQESA